MRRIGVAGVAAIAALATVAPAQAAPISFGTVIPLSTTEFNGALVANANGDAANDVVLTPGALGTAQPAILFGRGDASFFAPATLPGDAPQTERAAVGDLNLDGITDLVFSSAGGVRVLLGNGANGFGVQTLATGFVTDVAIANVVGDGFPEIVATPLPDATTPQNLVVLQRDGNGNYVPIGQTGTFAGVGPRSLEVADFDRDGFLDAAVGTSGPVANQRDVRVLFGNATGNFGNSTPPLIVDLLGEVDDIALGDLDRDGDVDVAATSKEAGAVFVLRNDGARTFTTLGPFPVGPVVDHVALADLDGDLVLDMGASSYTAPQASVSIFRGRGDGTFDAGVAIPAGGTGPPGLSFGDVNNDDRPDLVVAHRGPGTFPALFLNATPFPPPLPATGAASAVTLDAASLAGTVDTDGRRGFVHFEFGETTAYGTNTAEQGLVLSADAQTVAASLSALKPGTTYHYRVVARTLAGGVAAGADATFTTLDTVRLTKVTFNVKYKVSQATGRLVVTGTAPAGGAKVSFTLFRDAGKGRLVGAKRYGATLPAGAFSRRLRVPSSLLPGKYVVRVTGTIGTQPLVATQLAVTLKAPPEGVVKRSFASAVRNGPPTVRLPGTRTSVHANFVFAARPKKGFPIVARWFLPSGRLLASIPRANATRIDTLVFSRSALPKGRWRCELRVKGKLLAVVRVRIG